MWEDVGLWLYKARKETTEDIATKFVLSALCSALCSQQVLQVLLVKVKCPPPHQIQIQIHQSSGVVTVILNLEFSNYCYDCELSHALSHNSQP